MNARRILLVRHGRSAHVHAGWIDVDGFRRWREQYEAAGIVPDEVAPPALQELAKSAGAIVTSDLPRAIESARLLAPSAEITISPLLRELALVPADIRFRMPLAAWALTFTPRWLRNELATPAEHQSAVDAAQWLTTLADAHGLVIAITHHSMRGLIADELVRSGWTSTVPRRRKSAHWSTWTFDRPL